MNDRSDSTVYNLKVVVDSVALPTYWVVYRADENCRAHFCKLAEQPHSLKQPITVTHCLTVLADLTWSLFVHNVKITRTRCSLLSTTPEVLSPDTLNQLVILLNKLHVCAGQPDDKFVKMCEAQKRVFKNTKGEVVAYIDDHASVHFNKESFKCTVRHMKCDLLTNLDKCNHCESYRNSLRKSHSRWIKKSSENAGNTSSHVNIRFLSTPEKKTRIIKIKKRATKSEKQNTILREKISKLTEIYGEHVNNSLHDDLLIMMKGSSQEIYKSYSEGSFARLFWDEQLKAASLKNSKQMR